MHTIPPPPPSRRATHTHEMGAVQGPRHQAHTEHAWNAPYRPRHRYPRQFCPAEKRRGGAHIVRTAIHSQPHVSSSNSNGLSNLPFDSAPWPLRVKSPGKPMGPLKGDSGALRPDEVRGCTRVGSKRRHNNDVIVFGSFQTWCVFFFYKHTGGRGF